VQMKLADLGLFTALIAPLAVPSLFFQHPVGALGLMVQVFLLSPTMMKNLPKDQKTDEKLEENAIKSLVTTSYINRLTRFTLGSVHIAAALLFSTLWSNSVFKIVGSFFLHFMAGIWFITGYYGQ